MSYTPGPWKAAPPTQTTTFRIDTPKGSIFGSCSGLPKLEEWHANARLIAAAPDLLRACLIALDALGCDRTRQDRLEAQKIIHTTIKSIE